MKKMILKFIFFWVVWLTILSLHFEYIVSRPVNGYLQLGLTLVIGAITYWLIGKTVNNLTTNKKQND